MASSKLKLFPSPFLPAAGERGSPIKRPMAVATKRALVPFQVKNEKVQKPQALETFNVSRRDIMQYAATEALVGAAFLFTEAAEARVEKLENKRKIMDKLEKLREKFGISKPKAEAPPSQKSPDEKSLPTFPLPPQEGRVAGRVGPLVEATAAIFKCHS
ncbi:hypothetical protein SLEP1_g50924 [Rubroshorea leprosula]|uniref:Uncharacterized protein n=1 Tax=Rubroshorea leprosula TaxID=152421 RepID=A0AAV5M1M7_9ROSI|nr:hypothetical protein SLEP1_g50924 [Rubroshorea leprosula]